MESWRMELVAYLDDSGTDEANPRLVVPGFAADVVQWSKFNDEVVLLDREFDAPPYHAKIFEKARHGHGPYSRWPDGKRREYLNRFLGIIRRRCFSSFSTSLEKGVYENTIRRHQALREYFYSPFVFAAVNTIHAVRQWRDTVYPGDRLRFVFDKGNKNEGQLRDVGRVVVEAEHQVEDVAFGDDAELHPLRAADLLAFELCAEGRNASNPKYPYSRYGLIKLDEHPHDWVEIGEEVLLNKIAALINDGTFRIEEQVQPAGEPAPISPNPGIAPPN